MRVVEARLCSQEGDGDETRYVPFCRVTIQVFRQTEFGNVLFYYFLSCTHKVHKTLHSIGAAANQSLLIEHSAYMFGVKHDLILIKSQFL